MTVAVDVVPTCDRQTPCAVSDRPEGAGQKGGFGRPVGKVDNSRGGPKRRRREQQDRKSRGGDQSHEANVNALQGGDARIW